MHESEDLANDVKGAKSEVDDTCSTGTYEDGSVSSNSPMNNSCQSSFVVVELPRGDTIPTEVAEVMKKSGCGFDVQCLDSLLDHPSLAAVKRRNMEEIDGKKINGVETDDDKFTYRRSAVDSVMSLIESATREINTKTEIDKYVSCRICSRMIMFKQMNKAFLDKLLRHVREAHIKDYQCSSCDYMDHELQVRKHIEMEHRDARQKSVITISRTDAEVHKTVDNCFPGYTHALDDIGEATINVHIIYKCIACPEEVSLSRHATQEEMLNSLSQHIRDVHEQLCTHIYHCNNCQFESSQSNVMNAHLLERHREASVSSIESYSTKEKNQNRFDLFVPIFFPTSASLTVDCETRAIWPYNQPYPYLMEDSSYKEVQMNDTTNGSIPIVVAREKRKRGRPRKFEKERKISSSPVHAEQEMSKYANKENLATESADSVKRKRGRPRKSPPRTKGREPVPLKPNDAVTCQVCNMGIHVRDMILHVREHHQHKQFYCTICMHSSVIKSDVQFHMRMLHGLLEEPLDQIDQDMMTAWNRLEALCFPDLDLAEIQREAAKYEVDDDEELVEDVGYMALKIRKTMKKPRNYTRETCEMCGTSVTLGQLERHARQHHDERQYKCAQCTHRSTRLSDMKRHMIVVHNNYEDPIDMISQDMKMAWAALRIRCFPQSGANQLSGLEGDWPMEDKKLPVALDISGSSESDENWMLKKPNKTKTCRNREAECQICKMEIKIRQRSRHVRQHHDAQPYKCPICPSTSIRSDIIKKHMKRTHRLENVSVENHVTNEMRQAWKMLLPICFPLMDVDRVVEEKEGDSGDDSIEETTPNDKRNDDEKGHLQGKEDETNISVD